MQIINANFNCWRIIHPLIRGGSQINTLKIIARIRIKESPFVGMAAKGRFMGEVF
jgi:hypothetical protein